MRRFRASRPVPSFPSKCERPTMADPQSCADLFRAVDLSLKSEQAQEAALCEAAPTRMWTPSPRYRRHMAAIEDVSWPHNG